MRKGVKEFNRVSNENPELTQKDAMAIALKNWREMDKKNNNMIKQTPSPPSSFHFLIIFIFFYCFVLLVFFCLDLLGITIVIYKGKPVFLNTTDLFCVPAVCVCGAVPVWWCPAVPCRRCCVCMCCAFLCVAVCAFVPCVPVPCAVCVLCVCVFVCHRKLV